MMVVGIFCDANSGNERELRVIRIAPIFKHEFVMIAMLDSDDARRPVPAKRRNDLAIEMIWARHTVRVAIFLTLGQRPHQD